MDCLLDRIKSPQDLKDLSVEQLETLAKQIRTRLITTVSATGGHLAPNLGTVELTIALHTVFDSPHDRLIWDVGHQSYTHKLLTGRADRLHTIRQLDGLSGFPRRDESEHDAFGTGHGSTSISAALGFARARDLRGTDEAVIAIIGDGALTGGLAFEALNQAGHQKTDLTVVLNDNEMSISPNVGAMSAYLSRLRLSLQPRINQTRADVARVLERWRLGDTMMLAMDRLRDSVKHLVVPGMLFEEFGFTYLGPIDGHDIEQLLAILRHSRKVKGPILVHVLTTKGKGYRPAEADPSRFHGTRPFQICNGEAATGKRKPTYSSVAAESLIELAEKDKRICAISAAMLVGTGLKAFSERFPSRCFDVGMAEGHAVTYAAGLAAAGLRPVVSIYSTFLQRSYDQIIHDVALQRLPVVLCLDRAGLVGDDGPTHHGVFDLSYLRSIPGLVVMAPKDERELKDMLATALSHDGPSAIRYPAGAGPGADYSEPAGLLQIGAAELLSEGSDIAIVAVGRMVQNASEAVQLLAEQGVSARLINARFVQPLDEQILRQAARECGCILTVEENVLAGGFGSAVAELLVQAGIRARLDCVALPNEFVPHGNIQALWEQTGLTAPAIVQRALRLMSAQEPASLLEASVSK
jgi:1-deoxy-D-xylulose-5-phosphate synthase